MAQISTTQRGKPLLTLNGYRYQQHSKNKNGSKIYWRCVERATCTARTTTNGDLENITIIKDATSEHTHEKNVAAENADAIVQRIKRHASEHPNAPPIQVIREEVREQPEEVLALLPERTSIRRMVSRWQAGSRPPIPRSLQEIEIVPPYNETHANENFFIKRLRTRRPRSYNNLWHKRNAAAPLR